jgi:hypothetical protein
MDSIKPILAKLRQHQFWIFAAVSTITVIVVWLTATSELDAKFMADKQKNQSAFTSLEMFNRGGTNQLPNPHYKKAVDVVREDLEKQVVDAWKNLFERQRKVLTVNPRVGELEPYLVNEKFFQKEIPPNLRDQFHNNQIIEEDFRLLFDMLNLRRLHGVSPVDPVPPNAPTQIDGILVWNAQPSPRDMMLRYKTQLTPSTIRIRMTQEDLWIFRSLFGVIQRINSRPIDAWLEVLDGKQPTEMSVDQANVPIKEIDYCDLAQYAVSAAEVRPGHIFVPSEEDQGNADVHSGGGKMQSSFSIGTKGTTEEDQKLLEGRYLDGRNQPVADPQSPPFTEFKQIFVQLQVIMDQRLIPVLIAECANSDIAVETRQLLVDLSQVDVVRQVNAGEAARVMNKIETSPHDVQVTLRGVMFGYSPPDKSRLGQGSDPEPSKRDYGVPVKQE